jgi:cytochrome c556
MKRVLSVAFVLSLVLVGTVMAQAPMAKLAITSEADYSAVMKEVGSTNGMLGKAITSGVAADAAKGAARLEVLFKDVQAYWTAKKVDDATTAATSAVAAAQAISKAVAANDMTAAGEARTKLGAACMGCHTAHREKTPEGGWKMK